MKNESVTKVGKQSDAEVRKTRAIFDKISKCESDTSTIRKIWEANHTMFVSGSQFPGKENWQSDFSVNNFGKSIRAAQGHMVNTLVNQPDWWDMTVKNQKNQKAQFLKKPLKTLMDYHLEASNFKRHAGTFFMQSLISMGIIHVGYKKKMVLNPEWVLEKTREERRKEQVARQSMVANPESTDMLAEVDLAEQISMEIDKIVAEAQGEDAPAPRKVKQYVQYGCLDFQEPMPQFFYFEPSSAYMADSPWMAFEYQVSMTELKQMARHGYISKAALKRIQPMTPDERWGVANIRYKNINQDAQRVDMITLTAYYGPQIEEDEIVRDSYFCLIANKNVIIKEGDYPYWEPPGHKTPIVAAAVRQIPFRPTGAGIGDNARQLQQQFDSNLHLQCDTWRLNVGGLNVVNRNALIDKNALDEGIYPGKVIEVREKPRDAFERMSLTSNTENQVAPINEVLRAAIDDQTGNMDAVSSGPNLRSRTSAAEVNQRVQGAQSNLNIMALDLEENFLVPVLQKCLARILQFGISEIQSNYEVRALFDEEELEAMLSLSEADRLEIIQSYFSFTIDGFSANQDKKEKISRLNEFLQIASANPLLNSMVNWPELIKDWTRLMDLDTDRLLIIGESESARIVSENAVLMQNTMVIPGPNDNHEMHMQIHGPIAQSQFTTPALQQHMQMHQQALMQMQAMQQQQGGGNGEPPVQ